MSEPEVLNPELLQEDYDTAIRMLGTFACMRIEVTAAEIDRHLYEQYVALPSEPHRTELRDEMRDDVIKLLAAQDPPVPATWLTRWRDDY